MSRSVKAALGSRVTAGVTVIPARGYRESEWSGRPNYTCLACGFVTTDQALIEAHVAAHQPVAPPAPDPAPRPFGMLPAAPAPVTPEPAPSITPDAPAEEDEP